MEITIRQAVFAILSSSLAEGSPLFKLWTVKDVTNSLERVFGAKVSRRHIRRVIRGIAQEVPIREFIGKRKAGQPACFPREKLYKLTEPIETLLARKWKRDGH